MSKKESLFLQAAKAWKARKTLEKQTQEDHNQRQDAA